MRSSRKLHLRRGAGNYVSLEWAGAGRGYAFNPSTREAEAGDSVSLRAVWSP